LSGWNHKSHLFDHPCKFFRSFCRVCISSFDLISQNTFVSSANINTSEIVLSGRSFMYRTNKIGPRTLPWGIPLRTSVHSENCPLTDTRCFLFNRNDVTHLTIFPDISYDLSLPMSHLCGNILNALMKSRYITSNNSYGASYNVPLLWNIYNYRHLYTTHIVECYRHHILWNAIDITYCGVL